ncbi:MAG: DUF5036 family protein [Mediterranea sp.]|nr:DUF5036 family protein [Mediterranea sp.]
MNVGKWFMTLMMACTTIACGNYDPTDPNNSVPDPKGTISLRMRNGMDNATELHVGNIYIYIDNADNFASSSIEYECEFVDMGIMKGLGNVIRIPDSGWAPKIAVYSGHGYVVRSLDKQSYLRIYVVNYSPYLLYKEFDVKYQYPFNPLSVW